MPELVLGALRADDDERKGFSLLDELRRTVYFHELQVIAALAGSGELLASRTVKDLVAGSDYAFTSRGVHSLKGVPEEWELLAVS